MYPLRVSEAELRIRDAEPGDVRFIAWVMQEAARSHLERGIWDFAFPDAAQRIDFLAALASAGKRCVHTVAAGEAGSPQR